MNKKIIILSLVGVFSLTSCNELQQIANQLPQIATQGGLGQRQISAGLKEALKQGVDKEVFKLTQTNGFYNNPAVKILLPSELQNVEKVLRSAGLGSLADEGVKALNKAAEHAVKEATPVFVNAITSMSIQDATNILMGNKNAATLYLQKSTSNELYQKFNPIIKNSFTKVGADKVWSNLINKYNSIPLVNKVNPDITDYVTQQALEGVFKMIEKEELNIRTNISARTTPLLQSVFSMQDKNK